MDLDYTAGDEAFRAQVRGWLSEHVPDPPLGSLNTAEGFAAHREWERQLAGAGLAVISWPERYGGRNASLARWLVFEEEYYRAGGPVRVGQNGLCLLAPTLFAHGTAVQRDRVLPPMATGEQVWAQPWSEPGAGSDLAATRDVARRPSHLRRRGQASGQASGPDRAPGHGAIGYTQECDVSLWLAKVRALSATWGSQAEHRDRTRRAVRRPKARGARGVVPPQASLATGDRPVDLTSEQQALRESATSSRRVWARRA